MLPRPIRQPGPRARGGSDATGFMLETKRHGEKCLSTPDTGLSAFTATVLTGTGPIVDKDSGTRYNVHTHATRAFAHTHRES